MRYCTSLRSYETLTRDKVRIERCVMARKNIHMFLYFEVREKFKTLRE